MAYRRAHPIWSGELSRSEAAREIGCSLMTIRCWTQDKPLMPTVRASLAIRAGLHDAAAAKILGVTPRYVKRLAQEGATATFDARGLHCRAARNRRGSTVSRTPVTREYDGNSAPVWIVRGGSSCASQKTMQVASAGVVKFLFFVPAGGAPDPAERARLKSPSCATARFSLAFSTAPSTANGPISCWTLPF